jgi:hypothetical protein
LIVVKTLLLVLGMCLIGVRLLLGLLTPLVGFAVTRLLSERNWDAVMMLFTQLTAAAATYLIGALALDLPWYAALIAAVVVGLTSYTVRAPEPYSPAYYDLAPEVESANDDQGTV